MSSHPLLAAILISAFATFLPIDPAEAISRVGGGKLESAPLGFVATAPSEYPRDVPIGDKNLRLWSNRFFAGDPKSSGESFIELRTYGDEFSNFTTLNRSATAGSFAKMTWVRSLSPADPCIDVYERTTADVSAFALVWGPGRGVIILGGVSSYARSAIDEIVQSLHLKPGSCEW